MAVAPVPPAQTPTMLEPLPDHENPSKGMVTDLSDVGAAKLLVLQELWLVSGVISEMQAAAAAAAAEPAAAPIEWLPRELVAVVFCFVDIKTLMMTIPSVSR